MSDDTLTLKKLLGIDANNIFDTGLAEGGPEGLHIRKRAGEVRWAAVTGQIGDWAVYCGPADWTPHMAARSGDKLYDINKVKMVVPCDDEAAGRYRQ